MADYTDFDAGTLGVEYICRCVELVRARRMPIVLVACGVYYLAENPADPWGSKRFISHTALRELIDSIEISAPEALPKIGPASASPPVRFRRQSA